MKLAPRLALALLMAATLATGKAEDALDPEALRVATRFLKLAGSEDNAVALALVSGRRPVATAAPRPDIAVDDAPLTESTLVSP